MIQLGWVRINVVEMLQVDIPPILSTQHASAERVPRAQMSSQTLSHQSSHLEQEEFPIELHIPGAE